MVKSRGKEGGFGPGQPRPRGSPPGATCGVFEGGLILLLKIKLLLTYGRHLLIYILFIGY